MSHHAHSDMNFRNITPAPTVHEVPMDSLPAPGDCSITSPSMPDDNRKIAHLLASISSDDPGWSRVDDHGVGIADDQIADAAP
jgi:hypothetical protein